MYLEVSAAIGKISVVSGTLNFFLCVSGQLSNPMSINLVAGHSLGSFGPFFLVIT